MAGTQQTVTRQQTVRQRVGIFISHGHFSPVSLSEEEALGVYVSGIVEACEEEDARLNILTLYLANGLRIQSV